jgi:amidase
MAGFAEYDAYDALGLADLVRRREVSSAELVEEAVARTEARNPALNAVIEPLYERARAAAADPGEGPFAGVPFLIKDLGVRDAGVPMRNGSRFLESYVPDHDSELLRRYKAAGLICIGRTNTPELGMVPFTEPELFGPTHNPWELSRTPGGSSGGSAAAVAGGIVPMAHGGDGGGSIRIPAACCGLFGLKPTRARTPSGPDATEPWHGLAVDHVLSRSVRDNAAALDATAGPEVGDPYATPRPARPFLDEVGADPGQLRIAVTTRPYFPAAVHPDCVAATEAAAALCAELGHEVVEATPELDGAALGRAFVVMVAAEVAAEIASYRDLVGRQPTHADFEVITWVFSLFGRQFSAPDLATAVHTQRQAGRAVGRFLEDYDLMLSPTLALPPVPIGSLQPSGFDAVMQRFIARFSAAWLIKLAANMDAEIAKVFEFIPFTPLANITGQPAMSVPLDWNGDGLPIGVQFAARFGDEAALFRLAAQLEEARPWADRRPPAGS